MIISTMLLSLASVITNDVEPKKMNWGDVFAGMQHAKPHLDEDLGLYKYVLGPKIFYVSENGRYLINGDVFELQPDGYENITESDRTSARLQSLNESKELAEFNFMAEGAPRYSITAFMAPSCGFCRSMHGDLEYLTSNGVEIRYVLYAQGGRTSPDWDSISSVWCSENQNHALDVLMSEGQFKEDQECTDQEDVAASSEFGDLLGISFTPAIVDSYGEMIAGYKGPKYLISQLENSRRQNQATK